MRENVLLFTTSGLCVPLRNIIHTRWRTQWLKVVNNNLFSLLKQQLSVVQHFIGRFQELWTELFIFKNFRYKMSYAFSKSRGRDYSLDVSSRNQYVYFIEESLRQRKFEQSTWMITSMKVFLLYKNLFCLHGRFTWNAVLKVYHKIMKM